MYNSRHPAIHKALARWLNWFRLWWKANRIRFKSKSEVEHLVSLSMTEVVWAQGAKLVAAVEVLFMTKKIIRNIPKLLCGIPTKMVSPTNNASALSIPTHMHTQIAFYVPRRRRAPATSDYLQYYKFIGLPMFQHLDKHTTDYRPPFAIVQWHKMAQETTKEREPTKLELRMIVC